MQQRRGGVRVTSRSQGSSSSSVLHINGTVPTVRCFGFLHAWDKDFVRGVCLVGHRPRGSLQAYDCEPLRAPIKNYLSSQSARGGRFSVPVDSGRVDWLDKTLSQSGIGAARPLGKSVDPATIASPYEGIPVTWIILVLRQELAITHEARRSKMRKQFGSAELLERLVYRELGSADCHSRQQINN